MSATDFFPYFDAPKPRLFAHRGLAQHADLDENTIPAFQAALDHGATHLESDTQATADDVAVLFHDEDLSRVAGIDAKVRELSLSELKSTRLKNGGEIPTLAEALETLPGARFNLDIKTRPAISPTIEAIETLQAHDRVLVSSFSNPIRKSALTGLSRPIATSGSLSTGSKCMAQPHPAIWRRLFGHCERCARLPDSREARSGELCHQEFYCKSPEASN